MPNFRQERYALHFYGRSPLQIRSSYAIEPLVEQLYKKFDFHFFYLTAVAFACLQKITCKILIKVKLAIFTVSRYIVSFFLTLSEVT